MPKITVRQLAEVLAERMDLTQPQAAAIIEALTDEVMEQIKAGNEVDLPGFGKFSSKVYQNGSLPGEPKNGLRTPVFKAYRRFRQAMVEENS